MMSESTRIRLLGTAVMTVLLTSFAACAPPKPENVLFISLDTTRRDHLSVYGYERPTTPQIAAFAETSAVFENGFAHGTTTNATHASMFTSTYPHVHGVGSNIRQLPAEFQTMAEILRDNGLRTAGFVSGFPLKVWRTHLHQGFETWDARMGKIRRDGRKTTDLALEWLDSLGSDERFLLFVHLYDAHGPYRTSEYEEAFRSPDPGPRMTNMAKYQRVDDLDGKPFENLNQWVDRYDAQVRRQDDLVGDLLAAVDLESTVVIIVADHGESFDERSLQFSHGDGVWDEQIRIPFILHASEIVPGRYVEPVEQVDLLPTVLELLEIPPPADVRFQGDSLVSLLRGERDQRPDGLVFSSSRCNLERYRHKGYELRKNNRLHTVRTRRWKLVAYPGVESDYYELYDLDADPLEKIDVSEEFPDVTLRMRDALENWLRSGSEQEGEADLELSSEELEQMRALGYVD